MLTVEEDENGVAWVGSDLVREPDTGSLVGVAGE